MIWHQDLDNGEGVFVAYQIWHLVTNCDTAVNEWVEGEMSSPVVCKKMAEVTVKSF